MANEDLQFKTDKALQNVIKYCGTVIHAQEARINEATNILEQRKKVGKQNGN